MKWKILTTIAVVGLLLFSLFYANTRSDTDKLFANLIEQMEDKNYKQIYENSSDLVKSNVSEQVFAERMKNAFQIIKKVDGNLNFERDENLEQMIDNITEYEPPNSRFDSNKNLNWVNEKLGTGEDEIQIIVFWNDDYLFPKFRVCQ